MPSSPRGRSALIAAAVNVLANLVAASIVYLGGVLLGLFPREPGAVAAAVVVTLVAVVAATILISRFLAEDAKLAAAAAGTVLSGVAILIATTAGTVADPEVGSEGAAAGAVLVAGGLVLAVVWRRSRRRRLTAGRRRPRALRRRRHLPPDRIRLPPPGRTHRQRSGRHRLRRQDPGTDLLPHLKTTISYGGHQSPVRRLAPSLVTLRVRPPGCPERDPRASHLSTPGDEWFRQLSRSLPDRDAGAPAAGIGERVREFRRSAGGQDPSAAEEFAVDLAVRTWASIAERG